MSYENMTPLEVMQTSVSTIQSIIKDIPADQSVCINAVMSLWGVSLSFSIPNTDCPPTAQESAQLVVNSALGDIVNASATNQYTMETLRAIHSSLVKELLPKSERFTALQLADTAYVETGLADESRLLNPIVRELTLSIKPEKLEYTAQSVKHLDEVTSYLCNLNIVSNNDGLKAPNYKYTDFVAFGEYKEWVHNELAAGRISALNASTLLTNTLPAHKHDPIASVASVYHTLTLLNDWQLSLLLDVSTHIVMNTDDVLDTTEVFALLKTIRQDELPAPLFAKMVSAGKANETVLEHRQNHRSGFEALKSLT